MKRFISLSICALLLISLTLHAQDADQNVKPERKNYIKGGFYLGFGPVFPVGKYDAGQVVHPENATTSAPVLNYLPAKIGGAMDLGFLIYLGPSFANKHLRAGIDATFLSIWFNSTKPNDPHNSYEHYYYYGGQKFGPLFTINPVDRLMIDLSYKLNANFAYYFGEWHNLYNADYSKYGMNMFQNEVSLGIRYSIMRFCFQYSFGNMKYDNFDNARPTQTIEANTYRIMVGLKF
jgi:hypothetical protein